MKTAYDHIVIGAGALGSAAAYRLAAAGHTDVLVLEQYELGHTRGASEDHSRIIRHTYHSTTYTALTPAAYAAWDEVEDETGLQLVFKVGGLDLAVAGTPGEQELNRYESSLHPLAAQGVTWERLDAAEVRSRWPQWRIDDDVVGLFQPDGGILDVRRATAAHIALARGRGVEFAPGTTVLGLTSTDTHITVTTSRGEFTAGSVVLCAASWTPTLLPSLGVDWPITLSQEQVSYFATPNLRDFAPDRFPMWIWHGEAFFYGFPVYGEVAVKAARDLSGRFVTQETRSDVPDPAATEEVAAFLRDRLPGAAGPELVSKTCVYDLPPDREFILDHVPGHPRVVAFVGGGHAAKFASLLGRILADLAADGSTPYPIDAFRADRPALTDPAFVPTFRLTS
ncbi:N-methyl-L-tryptophan oxidase [Jiangella alkaliphila]|uniref:Sarcosine oxidase n=1 Tax=Jiangella alkaliphila TaxID=419479 RepID=A0A1H2KXU2_9ACTN|nr:N-methyl-L-tryptophan oxidase [Jiangella alkaliphila]SDU73553.1 sarcosine oxidase [Jiangella alkaliphila]